MQKRWPESDSRYRADLAACRALLATGSKSFHTASLVLPARVREPASALYAFCRLADDAIDLDPGKGPALIRLRRRLDRAYAGEPQDFAADRAFAQVVRRFRIPRALPEALLEGLAWDAEVRRYATIGDVRAYAVRVAGSVGAMMALIMGARDAEALARATDLGIAMQLSNIARDVGEDAREGRLYLPLDWLDDAGIDPEAFLGAPRFTPALGHVVKRLLDTADEFYRRAEGGIGMLPADCRPGIAAARTIYAEIGREVERAGYDSITRRAVVSKRRKLGLLAGALPRAVWAPRPTGSEPAAEASYLIAAVSALPVGGLIPSRSFAECCGNVLTILDRMERERFPNRAL